MRVKVKVSIHSQKRLLSGVPYSGSRPLSLLWTKCSVVLSLPLRAVPYS